MRSVFRSLLVAAVTSTVFISACEKKTNDIVVPEEKGPKWGYIDHSGKFVIKPKFRRVKDFHEGMAAADMHARWGYIDREGNWAIKRNYEDVKDFSAGYAAAQKAGKWGVIDRKGHQKLPFTYVDIGVAHEVNPDAEDHAVLMPIKEKDLWGFKDFGPHGKGDIHFQWTEVKHFNDGLCPVKDRKSGKWGFINNKGEVVIDYKFDSASVFQNRVAECMMADDFIWVDQIGTLAKKSRLKSRQLFSEEVALQQRKGKFVFINRRGKRAFRKKFRYADNFSEGLAVVQPLRSVKKGYIDNRGHLVIDDIYNDARAFSEQLAAVKVDPDEFFNNYNENGTPKSSKKPEKEKKEKDELSVDEKSSDDKKEASSSDSATKSDDKKEEKSDSSKEEKKSEDKDKKAESSEKKDSKEDEVKSKDKGSDKEAKEKSESEKKSDKAESKESKEKK